MFGDSVTLHHVKSFASLSYDSNLSIWRRCSFYDWKNSIITILDVSYFFLKHVANFEICFTEILSLHLVKNSPLVTLFRYWMLFSSTFVLFPCRLIHMLWCPWGCVKNCTHHAIHRILDSSAKLTNHNNYPFTNQSQDDKRRNSTSSLLWS